MSAEPDGLEQPRHDLTAPTGAETPPPDDPTAAIFDPGPERAAPAPGTTIGQYQLIERIGEGGFGCVYQAHQDEPVCRDVAVKVIKPGMDSREVIGRFQAERQALALMDHPNIATVHDAGATGTGTPYFVMELVRGVPITDHCRARNLDTAARIDLFTDVCHAVQHAHLKGIIHRDIKPSNVLVTEHEGRPVPKVIDFGIAKATDQRMDERTFATEIGRFIGTPAYVSPEQVDGAPDIDTRSDIYALGVLLYELLTGSTPFDRSRLRSARFPEFRRIVCEEAPPRPSTVLSGIAERPALARTLRGDLDWIVMKALDKDRTRRYQTAAALVDDLRRHLGHEPVSAGPPSAGYRFRKFARRHRTLLGAAGAVAAAIVLGTSAAVYGFVEAVEARDDAVTTADVLGDAFTSVDPGGPYGRDVTVLEILEVTAERLDEIDKPLIRARVAEAIGNAYLTLGDHETATTLLEKALAIYREGRGADDPGTLDTEHMLAEAAKKAGRLAEAETLYRSAVAGYTEHLGPDALETLRARGNLGNLYIDLKRYDEAEQVLAETRDTLARTVGEDHDATMRVMNNLGGLFKKQGRRDDEEAMFERTLELRQANLGPEHPQTLVTMVNLAGVVRRHDTARAEQLFLDAVAAGRRVRGRAHPMTITGVNNLASLYRDESRFDEANELYAEAVRLFREHFRPEYPRTGLSLWSWARCRMKMQDHEGAEAKLLEAIEILEATDHPSLPTVRSTLAELYEVWRPAATGVVPETTSPPSSSDRHRPSGRP